MSTQVFSCLLILGLATALPRSLFQDADDEDVIPGFKCDEQGFADGAGKECCGGDCIALNTLKRSSTMSCCSSDTDTEVCCQDPRLQYNNPDAFCTDATKYVPEFPDDIERGIEEVCSWTCCPTLDECPQDPTIAPPFTCGQKFNINTTAAPTTAAPTAPTAPTKAPTTASPTTASPTTAAPTTAAPTASPTTAAPTAAPTTAAPTTAAPTASPTTAAPTTAAPTNAPTTTAPTGAPTDKTDFVDGICDRRCGSIGWERNRIYYRSLTKEGMDGEDSGIVKNYYVGSPYGPPRSPYGPGRMPYGPTPYNPYNPYSPSYRPAMNPYFVRPQCDPYNWNSNWYWCAPPPPPPPPMMPTDDGPRPTYPDVADCYRRGGRDCRCSCDKECNDEGDCCKNYDDQCVF